MARKSRQDIKSGINDLISSSGPDDILSNVIHSDQRRGGRINQPLTENTGSSEVVSATSSEVAKTVQIPVLLPNMDTLQALLSAPYQTDPLKGPFTVSTLKIPIEISDRLGIAASFMKRPKQEIVAEALLNYLELLSQSKE